MYCNILQRCYFPTCLASPRFLAKDFPSRVTHYKSYAYFIKLRETNGRKENTVRVTVKRSILLRLKTLVHNSKTILNTKKVELLAYVYITVSNLTSEDHMNFFPYCISPAT